MHAHYTDRLQIQTATIHSHKIKIIKKKKKGQTSPEPAQVSKSALTPLQQKLLIKSEIFYTEVIIR